MKQTVLSKWQFFPVPMLRSQQQSSETKAFSGLYHLRGNNVSICAQKQPRRQGLTIKTEYFCSNKAVDKATFSAGKLEKQLLIALFYKHSYLPLKKKKKMLTQLPTDVHSKSHCNRFSLLSLRNFPEILFPGGKRSF